jgi:lipopolysaccharide export system protein LptA
LAREIQQESENFDYTHNFGAHSKFRIHAAKAIQLKNEHIDLRGVEIEINGADGSQSDRIAGDEFEYDEKSGVATAEGPVEMFLTRPPAQEGNGSKSDRQHTAEGVAKKTSQVRVKTSGISFDRNTGVVTTAARVDFSITQGSGSAVGASFDSQSGYLKLMQSVELATHRGGDPVQIHAQHAEFDRGAHLCELRAATLEYRNGEAHAAQASILFRDDGSAQRLDAAGGFQLTTATGGRLASPTAVMDFDEHNQPRHGHMGGGVTMDSAEAGRTVHGTSPTAELEFNAQGQLRRAHLERGVTFASKEARADTAEEPLQVSRTWRSPVADVDFRTVESAGKTQVEPETIHGTGGVAITSESQRGAGARVPAKMSADEVTGRFGAGSALRTLVGAGHAEMEQTTATGTLQTASGDRLTAEFVENQEQGSKGTRGQGSRGGTQTSGAPDVQSAELDGHVVLFQQPAAKSGAQPRPPLRVTAGKAAYEGDGEWLHLLGNSRTGGGPRIVKDGLELTAEKVDVSRQSGDAFAHGNVKATWFGGTQTGGAANGGGNQGGAAFGGNGPAHVIAAEAQLNESTGEAAFRGHARLWQQANSVAAPEIVLNQHLETMVAKTSDARDPVRAVLVSAGAPGAGNARGQGVASSAAKTATPSVIRVRGGELRYFAAEYRAVMHGGVAGAAIAETATATSASDTVDLRLIPAGDLGGGQAQVDRMTATGHVVLTAQGRRGTGEQLACSGVTGDCVLTGTAAAPPRMTSPEQGSVTGEALILHSRDDSVSIEGGGHATRTETTAPEAHGK